MRKVRISDLSEDVRGFVAAAYEGGGVVVEDEAGRPQVSVLPFRPPTREETERANKSLERLREKTGKAMQEAGVTEEDVIRAVLEDD